MSIDSNGLISTEKFKCIEFFFQDFKPNQIKKLNQLAEFNSILYYKNEWVQFNLWAL